MDNTPMNQLKQREKHHLVCNDLSSVMLPC
jgi:hypothetical protein